MVSQLPVKVKVLIRTHTILLPLPPPPHSTPMLFLKHTRISPDICVPSPLSSLTSVLAFPAGPSHSPYFKLQSASALSALCYSRALSPSNILYIVVYLCFRFTVYLSPLEHKSHEDRGFYFVHCYVPWF